MPKKTLTIALDEEILKALKSRAKKEFLTVKELAEDIIRRSTISYKRRKGSRRDNVKDPYLRYFSRKNVGRRPKKRKKKAR